MQGHITIWLSWSPEELNTLQELMRAFQARHPAVSFSLVYLPRESLLARFQEALQAGEQPTLLLGPSSWAPALWRGGWLLDATPLLTQDLQEAVLPDAWSQVTVDGARVGVPLNLEGVVLYRNAALVDQAPATVADLVQAAAALRGGGKVGASLDFGLLYSAAHLSACGGRLFDAEGDLALDLESGTCWLTLLQQLAGAGPGVVDTEEDRLAFQEGRSAWLVESTLARRDLLAVLPKGNLRVDPWPVYQATGKPLRGFLWTENAYLPLTASGPDLEATWSFLQFLLDPGNQQFLSDPLGAGRVPVVAGVEPLDPLAREIQAALAGGEPRPFALEGEQDLRPLVSAVRLAALQGGDPRLAMELALLQLIPATPTPGP